MEAPGGNPRGSGGLDNKLENFSKRLFTLFSIYGRIDISKGAIPQVLERSKEDAENQLHKDAECSKMGS